MDPPPEPEPQVSEYEFYAITDTKGRNVVYHACANATQLAVNATHELTCP